MNESSVEAIWFIRMRDVNCWIEEVKRFKERVEQYNKRKGPTRIMHLWEFLKSEHEHTRVTNDAPVCRTTSRWLQP
jgi:hypothetical protein